MARCLSALAEKKREESNIWISSLVVSVGIYLFFIENCGTLGKQCLQDRAPDGIQSWFSTACQSDCSLSYQGTRINPWIRNCGLQLHILTPQDFVAASSKELKTQGCCYCCIILMQWPNRRMIGENVKREITLAFHRSKIESCYLSEFPCLRHIWNWLFPNVI